MKIKDIEKIKELANQEKDIKSFLKKSNKRLGLYFLDEKTDDYIDLDMDICKKIKKKVINLIKSEYNILIKEIKDL